MAAVSSSSPNVDALTPQLERDEYFWFENLVFKAGSVVFKVVPQYSLPIEDEEFAALLKPAPGERQTCGLSEEDPIILPAEVTAQDFRSLLKACNPKPNSRNATLAVDEWMSVLKLSKMWSLDSLRPRAIEEVDKLVAWKSPIEKILLGKKYAVSKWLLEGYEALGKRRDMVHDKERAVLDENSFVGLVTLREKAAAAILQDAIAAISSESKTSKYTPTTFRDKFDFKSAVKVIFAKELKKDKEYVA
ncbi:hypothetical protein OF83DRAFT_1177805 [Amylostereum chailletii]|nr:hypothetical protein OF83DRAFT_1177805 [Amylostereum chailletii]